ncbi:MAG TPA: sugar ABC transporter ATP-binding protein [Capillimicrobium sp.]|nr:sugar ABC transporter ATP-binding protein [Capillimicrobium sp.]
MADGPPRQDLGARVRAGAEEAAPVVRMRGVGKSFDGTTVLSGVDLDLRPGEVHGLMGENGAGKSTLMKILLGIYTPDAGTIEVAPDARIAMIFQEFSLVPTLTVAQNVFLDREARTRAGLIDDRETERRARALFEELEIDLDVTRPVSTLPTAYWQLTEIAKALSQDARVLVMDEPTSSLARAETENLFALIRRLRDRGIAIVYISHRMEEIFEIVDRVTVLRDGRLVITEDASALTLETTIEHIVGRSISDGFRWRPPKRAPGEPLLQVEGLTADPLQDLSFEVRAGEVLGVAGLLGSGRTELATTLFGVRRATAGTIRVHGQERTIRRPHDAIASGLALVPEDRRVQGLVLAHSLRDNVLLPVLGTFTRRGMVQDRRGNDLVRRYMERLRIAAPSIQAPARLLSGGNQQKVVLAKWLATEPDVLIMDEPTAGVDIGAKVEIVEMIRELADAGNAILLFSSELPELLAVSDRLLLLRAGRVQRVLARAEIADDKELHHMLQDTTTPAVA